MKKIHSRRNFLTGSVAFGLSMVASGAIKAKNAKTVMRFEHDVYIVLDVAEPLAGSVTKLRERFDARSAGLPVEIGVAGSSGLGTLVNEQDPQDVFRILKKMAESIETFDLMFQSLKSFPGTNWHYLEPVDPEPFYHIHDVLKVSGIEFKKSPYPYTPHCSVADLEDRADQEIALKECGIPEEGCQVDKISVYSLKPDWSCSLLFQVPLQLRS